MEKNSPNRLGEYNDKQRRRAEAIERGEKKITELFRDAPKQDDTENLINDLCLALSFYVEGYPFDDEHRTKHRTLINKAYDMIGIPDTIKDILNRKESDKK